uniref:Uncharacterized protein n=1 Tax=Gossypium raimondii TaxID=29730 RepID=A0A0D2SAS8_GOSRA|nr:hypothetical protein B456_007G092000 [Gossypium raimondii]
MGGTIGLQLDPNDCQLKHKANTSVDQRTPRGQKQNPRVDCTTIAIAEEGICCLHYFRLFRTERTRWSWPCGISKQVSC